MTTNKFKSVCRVASELAIIAVLVGCSTDGRQLRPAGPGQGESIAIMPTTTVVAIDNFDPGPVEQFSVAGAWQEGGPIDARHTCHGENISPGLTISNLPRGTQGLAIVITELTSRDQPLWVVANIDPSQLTIHEGQVPNGAIVGAVVVPQPAGGDGAKMIVDGYAGPCVTDSAAHEFVVVAYALGQPVEYAPESLSLDSTKLLIQAIQGNAFEKTATMFIAQAT